MDDFGRRGRGCGGNAVTLVLMMVILSIATFFRGKALGCRPSRGARVHGRSGRARTVEIVERGFGEEFDGLRHVLCGMVGLWHLWELGQ